MCNRSSNPRALHKISIAPDTDSASAEKMHRSPFTIFTVSICRFFLYSETDTLRYFSPVHPAAGAARAISSLNWAQKTIKCSYFGPVAGNTNGLLAIVCNITLRVLIIGQFLYDCCASPLPRLRPRRHKTPERGNLSPPSAHKGRSESPDISHVPAIFN